MEIKLPAGTPPNIERAFNESQRILDEAFSESIQSAQKYARETKNRKYLAYSLKFVSITCAILITAGYLPHQLALAVAIIYAIDTVLSNSKRLVSITQASKAYTTIEKKLVRNHQVEQNKLFSESDAVEMVKKITVLNIALTEEAHDEFRTVEYAIDKSDIETLQALSLDEEKLNVALKHIQGKNR